MRPSGAAGTGTGAGLLGDRTALLRRCASDNGSSGVPVLESFLRAPISRGTLWAGLGQAVRGRAVVEVVRCGLAVSYTHLTLPTTPYV